MEQSTGYFSSFLKTAVDKLISISGSYVDDILQAENTRRKTAHTAFVQKQV